MKGQMLELAQMMGEMERRLSDKVAAVHAGVEGLDGRMTTAVQAAKDAQTAFRTELLGDGGRVKELEDELKNQRLWNNVRSIVVVPVLLGIHKGLVALGIKI